MHDRTRSVLQPNSQTTRVCAGQAAAAEAAKPTSPKKMAHFYEAKAVDSMVAEDRAGRNGGKRLFMTDNAMMIAVTQRKRAQAEAGAARVAAEKEKREAAQAEAVADRRKQKVARAVEALLSKAAPSGKVFKSLL
jgi:hypothetical protein